MTCPRASSAHTYPEVQYRNIVQSFSRSSVSTVRGPAGWSGQRLISRSLILGSQCRLKEALFRSGESGPSVTIGSADTASLIPAHTPGAASLRPPAGQLAGRATLHICPSSRLSQSGILR
jgi:hypothetical protein